LSRKATATGSACWICIAPRFIFLCSVFGSTSSGKPGQGNVRATRNTIEEDFSLVLLGRVALALNDLAAAEASTGEIDALIKVTKMPLVLFPHHLLCAQIAERMRNWDDAEWHYHQAARELEVIRHGFTTTTCA